MFVTTISLIGDSASRWGALPESTGCVAAAKISPAPTSASALAPSATVPAVSIMSSISTQGLPSTSPTTDIFSMVWASYTERRL